MHTGLRGVRRSGLSIPALFTVFVLLYYYVTLVHVGSISQKHEETELVAADVEIRNASQLSSSQAMSLAKENNSNITASEVLLLLKTGSSTLWRRLPLHLLTTFAHGRVPNYVLYSDLDEYLSPGIQAIDVLANITEAIRQHSPLAYDLYQKQKAVHPSNPYFEQA